MAKGKIVAVSWLDAHTLGNDEVEPDDTDIELHFGYPIVSVGHLIKRDKKGISLCTDLQTDPNTGAIIYRNAHFIPKGMISKVKLLT